LVSTADEVISVNAAIICGAQGIPFAIASNTAELMPGEIIQHGRFRRGYVGLGAATTPVPRRIALRLGIAQNSGASITAIEPGSPASESGLMTGLSVYLASLSSFCPPPSWNNACICSENQMLKPLDSWVLSAPAEANARPADCR